MTEVQPAEATYPNYVLLKEEYMEKGEFEVPAKVLDLLTSYYESSTKPEYSWNNPPYRKIMGDGSYWQVKTGKLKIQAGKEIMEKDSICVYVVSWTSNGEACLLDDIDILLLVVRWAGRFNQIWSDPNNTEVELKSKHRDRKLPLFNVYRKLLFYKNLIGRNEKEKKNE
ncbi:MAG: hypothetical protein QXT73_07385 [Candidatus Methanomethylicaceae archaeon]